MLAGYVRLCCVSDKQWAHSKGEKDTLLHTTPLWLMLTSLPAYLPPSLSPSPLLLQICWGRWMRASTSPSKRNVPTNATPDVPSMHPRRAAVHGAVLWSFLHAELLRGLRRGCVQQDERVALEGRAQLLALFVHVLP